MGRTIITIITSHGTGEQLHGKQIHQEIEADSSFSSIELDDLKGVEWHVDVHKNKIIFCPKKNDEFCNENRKAYIRLYTSCCPEVEIGRGRLVACFDTSSRSIELEVGSAASIQFGRSHLWVSRDFPEFEHPIVEKISEEEQFQQECALGFHK